MINAPTIISYPEMAEEKKERSESAEEKIGEDGVDEGRSPPRSQEEDLNTLAI